MEKRWVTVVNIMASSKGGTYGLRALMECFAGDSHEQYYHWKTDFLSPEFQPLMMPTEKRAEWYDPQGSRMSNALPQGEFNPDEYLTS